MTMSATTELDGDHNTEDKSDNASELPSFAAIVEDAVSEGILLNFNIPGRFLTAALSAIMTTRLRHGFMVLQRMALAEATVKCARETYITFTR